MTDSNPLCHIFPIEMSDFIFQHFTGTELLKLSEVSPSFYNYTAASKACMKKIAIKLEATEMTDDDKRVLVESDRKYKHFQVKLSSDLFEPARKILAVPGRKWMNVVVNADRIDMNTTREACKFFKSVQADVERFVLRNVAPDRIPEQSEVTYLQLKNFESSFYPFVSGKSHCGSDELYMAVNPEVLMNLAKQLFKKMLKMGDTPFSREFWQTIANGKAPAPIYPGLETVSCMETIIVGDGRADIEITTYIQIKPQN